MKYLLKMFGFGLLALSLLACGGDDDDPGENADDTDETEETSSTTEAEEESTTTEAEDEDTTTTEAADDEPQTDVEMTAPGTQLAVGDSAVVPYDDESMSGLVEITVTGIEPGDRAAFDAAFGEDAATIDPFYIHYTVELVAIDPEVRVDTPSLRGTSADGGPTGTVVTGSIDGCESERLDSDAEVGDSVETCRLQGAASGEVVGGAEYDEHDDYTNDPVLWLSA